MIDTVIPSTEQTLGEWDETVTARPEVDVAVTVKVPSVSRTDTGARKVIT
jgi:hypothetical protein